MRFQSIKWNAPREKRFKEFKKEPMLFEFIHLLQHVTFILMNIASKKKKQLYIQIQSQPCPK